MESLLWPIGLILLGLALLACEAFIPSGGVLGVLSAVSMLAGIGMAFYTGGTTTGTVFLCGTAVAVMCALAALVRWWPKTPFGRLILIDPPIADEMVPDLSPLRQLVGQVGQARALMLPGGLVEIEGQTYDAIAVGPSIEKGTWVEVTSVQGRNLLVRPINEERLRQLKTTRAGDSDLVSPPSDDTIPDPFVDPLA